MKITVESDEQTALRMANIIKTVFDVKKTSNFYPNAINSETDKTGRIYLTLNGFRPKSLPELLVNDMLSLLCKAGIDLDSDIGKVEVSKIMTFYETASRNLEIEKSIALYTAWRDNIIDKYIK